MNRRQLHSFIFSGAEKVFTVVMLFYVTGAILPFIQGKGNPSTIPKLLSLELYVKVAFYSIAFCFIAIRWRSILEATKNIKWIIALLPIAFVSTAWSQYPLLTLRRSAVFFAATVFGVYFGTRCTIRQQLRFLAWMCFLVILFSIFFAIFLPGYGIAQGLHSGDWQGVFNQKNALGGVMALAVFVFVFVRPKRFQWLRWVGAAASIALLLLSNSVTAISVFALISGVLALYWFVRRRLTVLIPIAGACLLLVGLMVFQRVTVAAAFHDAGRRTDLTGRTELWSVVLTWISKRPLLGYGFSAFWRGMNGDSGALSRKIGWMPYHAHDGGLDVLLQLGIIGFVILAVGYVSFWRRAVFLCTRQVVIPEARWLLTYLMFILVYNIAESTFDAHNFYWILYVSTAVSLYSASFRQPNSSKAGRARQPIVPTVSTDQSPVL